MGTPLIGAGRIGITGLTGMGRMWEKISTQKRKGKQKNKAQSLKKK